MVTGSEPVGSCAGAIAHRMSNNSKAVLYCCYRKHHKVSTTIRIGGVPLSICLFHVTLSSLCVTINFVSVDITRIPRLPAVADNALLEVAYKATHPRLLTPTRAVGLGFLPLCCYHLENMQ